VTTKILGRLKLELESEEIFHFLLQNLWVIWWVLLPQFHEEESYHHGGRRLHDENNSIRAVNFYDLKLEVLWLDLGLIWWRVRLGSCCFYSGLFIEGDCHYGFEWLIVWLFDEGDGMLSWWHHWWYYREGCCYVLGLI